ncbi:MAG: OmpH family outer membrane protein [Bacteroidales bacterium]|jgi:outer membrane protein|nr:OmpH family outer membrane protein [Bacteroidales bacterium]
MKNTLKAVLLVAFMLTATLSWSQANLKIGYIDSQALIELMPEKDSVEMQLMAYQRSLEEQIGAMYLEYQNKVEDYTNNSDGMSDIIKQTKQREIADLETRITDFQQSAEGDFAAKQQQLYDPLITKARNAITAVAEENGFTYILDVSMGTVLYYEAGVDVLPLVKAKLGL